MNSIEVEGEAPKQNNNSDANAGIVGEIVQSSNSFEPMGVRLQGLPKGLVASHEVQMITVDSGACDSIVPPIMFKNTPSKKHHEFGRTYAACGGETVTNLGIKNVNCLLQGENGKTINRDLKFQVGDKVTRGLLAVSQLANDGAGIWFGPGPEFKSFIVWDKDAFVAAAGPKANIKLSNGTYQLPINEIYKMKTEKIMAAVGTRGHADADMEPPDTGGAQSSTDVANSPNITENQVKSSNNEKSNVVSVPVEAPPVKVIRSPEQPTQEDIEKHRAAGHNPFRSWCPVCVAAAAPDDPHPRAVDKPSHEFPVFSSDYAFMGTKDSKDKITLYIVKESKSKSIFSTVVPRKGVSENELAVTFMLDCIAELGYAHHTVYLKNDQEPAIQSVIQGVVQGRSAPTLLEESPVGSSQSNGSAENAVSCSERGIRKLRIALEDQYKLKIPLEHNIIPWLVQHAGFAYNRFQVGHDGKTPYSRIRGRSFDKSLCEFGECIHYKIPKRIIGPELNKWDERWAEGIFLGVRAISSELWVGTPQGVLKVRTIRRRVPDSRWNPHLLNNFVGVPWDRGARPVEEPSSEEQLKPLPSAEQIPQQEILDAEKQIRDFKIYRKDILQREKDHGDGFTPNCPGCLAARRNAVPKNHSPACRAKYKAILLEDVKSKKRVAAADKRRADPPSSATHGCRNPKSDAKEKKAIEKPAEKRTPIPPVFVPVASDPYEVVSPSDDLQEAAEMFMSDDEDIEVGDGQVPEGAGEDVSIGLLANIAQEYIKFGKHVSEIFSPPRVTKVANKIGLRSGFALDLSVDDPEDGKPWDFSTREKREKAEAKVLDEKPFLLIGCPPCRAFSVLFSSNISRMKPEQVKAIIKEGITHLLFCIRLYWIQLKAGRHFLHEHPWGAWSWKLPEVQELLNHASVKLGKGHMCVHGMTATDTKGTAPILKATGWMTSSNFILQELAKQCTNNGSASDHRHASLEQSRAAGAAIYSDKLCYAILRGLRKQLCSENTMNVGELGTVSEDATEKQFTRSLGDAYFVDDVSGKKLESESVLKAREDERKGVVRHNVFTKVPIQECFDNTGCAPVSTKWIDINKGDENDPDYRSRWVGREFKGNDRDRDDLFAATPPLEAKRSLIAMASCQVGIPKHKQKKLGFIDIRKAYFHAKAKRLVYVKLPEEFCEPGEFGQVCGRLNYSLYGTRDAANNWEECYTEALVELGFKQGLASPCVFYHPSRDISTVVHGDDFTSLAVESQLIWMKQALEKKFLIKDRGILGPDKHDLKEIRLLNRIIAWENDHIRYEADQRHSEILIKEFALEGSKGVETPGVNENRLCDDEEDNTEPLPANQVTKYRAAAARCNFLGLDRPDVQYAAKEVSRGMANPTNRDLLRLKRLVRYLVSHPRAVFIYPFREKPKALQVFTDTDWAGCIKTRKSTQGGVCMLGGCCVKSWSSTQSLISLSSGESEYYGVVKGASVGLGVQAMLKDLGFELKLEVLTDASAAKGIASRRGLGKTRHIQVHFLWVQERVGNGDIVLKKCWGGENPADLLTKNLNRQTMLKCMQIFGIHHTEGRAISAPSIENAKPAVCCIVPTTRW